MTRWWSFRWRMVVVAIVFVVFLTSPGRSQPQTNLLRQTCSPVNATNIPNFFNNLNDTFRDIRRQLSNNNTYFATSELARNSVTVYVMAQCRKYMSTRDCVSCFDFAASSIRSCATLSGARSVLDGCFLRIEQRSR
ncbi:putative Gnk2-like domain-containing protein [Helianthus annuus]|uniref:Gnk2-like domain-containing protein n=2 Tax=Helianthus annuus TaxID=4232 RepID=A0A9K3NFB9_HELAN|nr:putative Gnk2-like domain-containing protein [Helianthus annuus]KAJ0904504.1 putative Gnk2-like domain-containing protein [Helianthus annuus]